MAGNKEQFSELNRKSMDAAIHMAQLSMDNSRRIMALQSDLAKEMFQSGIENVTALAAAKDPQAAMKLRTQFAQQTTERMMAAAQQIAEISSAARAELTRLVSEQLASGSHDMTESMQAIMKTLPNQTPNMMESFQQSVATATAAFEKLSKASTAAMSSAGATVKKATSRAKRK
jgi:phasin family protein